MKTIRRMAAAFAYYSRIPMPHIKLDDEDTKHAITYLPLVGALIGLITCGAFRLFLYADIPAFVKACITVIIPIAVTGGFHIDGFLDTADALASYRSNEKKLEILKDPHIGSFAVISFCVCILLMLGGIGVIIDDDEAPILLSAVYMISRALAALTSVYFDKAKPDGMLAAETAKADGTMIVILVAELIFGAVFALLARASTVPVLAVAYALFTFIYKKTVMKNFGGVTGDTAGYYVVASEVTAVCAMAIFYTVMKSL